MNFRGRRGTTLRVLPAWALFAVLVIGQAVVVHAHTHDTDTSNQETCGLCLPAQQVDSPLPITDLIPGPGYTPVLRSTGSRCGKACVRAGVCRARAPPHTFL